MAVAGRSLRVGVGRSLLQAAVRKPREAVVGSLRSEEVVRNRAAGSLQAEAVRNQVVGSRQTSFSSSTQWVWSNDGERNEL